jgi:hypothetical protein
MIDLRRCCFCKDTTLREHGNYIQILFMQNNQLARIELVCMDCAIKSSEVKQMVEADFTGNFVNENTCQENDVGIVLSEGEYENKVSMKGKPYQQLNIDVEVNGKKLIHSLRIMEGRKLVAIWGKDTKKWIGKKFICHLIRQQVGKEIKNYIEIEPFEEQKV